ncbi:hypothetical protein ANCCAN_16485, partial [Ancylostoma caninum]
LHTLLCFQIKDGPSAKELKDLGNKLFAAKKYDDSIRIFSKAITSSDSEETPLLKAMCFQNRAAAKEEKQRRVRTVVTLLSHATVDYKPLVVVHGGVPTDRAGAATSFELAYQLTCVHVSLFSNLDHIRRVESL